MKHVKDFCNMKHAIQQLMTSVREHEARYSSTNDFCKHEDVIHQE